MRPILVVILLGIPSIIFTSCALRGQRALSLSELEHAVYSASLEARSAEVVEAGGGVHRIRAHADTMTSLRAPSGDWVEAAAARMELPPGLFADLRRRNSETLCLDTRRFTTEAPVVLIADNSPCSGTPAANIPVPQDSLLTGFSRVGFTPARDEALMMQVFDCGTRCGGIGLVHLKREGSSWKVFRYEQVAQF